MSLAKRSTAPPGSLWPTSPSVQVNWSMSGSPKASLITVRLVWVSCSPIAVTETGAIASRPARCSPASRASLEVCAMTTSGRTWLSRRTRPASGSVAGAEIARTG